MCGLVYSWAHAYILLTCVLRPLCIHALEYKYLPFLCKLIRLTPNTWILIPIIAQEIKKTVF